MGRKTNLVRQLPLCSLETIRWLFHMLVILVWFNLVLERQRFLRILIDRTGATRLLFKKSKESEKKISNGRICGDIAVSRAFGDMRFKTKKNEMLKKGVEERRWTEKFASRVQFNGDLVTASPDVFQVTFGTDSEFVLLASDGLWDYINSSDAVTFVRNQLRKHGDVQLACDALAEAALDQRSQDNISIVIADLGRTDWQGLPFQQQNVVYEFGQAFATVGIVSLGIWISTSLLST